jgi:A/G-specific adenine glycosylase
MASRMRDLGATRGAEQALAATLLQWYDRHARDLPWRVSPARRVAGVRPDPYAVWLSEIMLQQTTVAAVERYFRRFMALWPDVIALAAEDDDRVMAEWAGLGYYARARNLLRCAREVSTRFGGQFPDDPQALRALPGIGPYTAAAIAAIAFDRPAAVMDGNIERVMARLFAVQTPLPRAKPELAALAARLTPAERPGCHAQALMDLGATVCTPRNPSCTLCPLARFCAGFREGLAAHASAADRETRQTGAARACLRRPPRRWCLAGGTAATAGAARRNAGLAGLGLGRGPRNGAAA